MLMYILGMMLIIPLYVVCSIIEVFYRAAAMFIALLTPLIDAVSERINWLADKVRGDR